MALRKSEPKSNKAFLIICPCCQIRFGICRTCYTGNKYCSEGCRDWGYKINKKKANKTYSSSAEAKKDHCDRNRVYRQKLRDNQFIQKKSVMDKPSDEGPVAVKKGPAADFCQICGKSIPSAKESLIENMELQFFDPY